MFSVGGVELRRVIVGNFNGDADALDAFGAGFVLVLFSGSIGDRPAIEMYTLVAVVYLVICFSLSQAVDRHRKGSLR